MMDAAAKDKLRGLSTRISSGFKKAGLSDSAVFATEENRHWITQYGYCVHAYLRTRLIPLSITHTELLVRFAALLLLSSLFLLAVSPAHAAGNCPMLLGPTDQTDIDGDGVGDACDNCLSVSNSDQRDTNADGFGNICDADINQDHLVNLSDFSLFRIAYGANDPDADFNGDGLVNLSDFSLFRVMYGSAPGPSGLTPKVDNTRPLADAGPDQTVSVGATVTLDASATTDLDGGPLGYLWTLTAAPVGSSAVLTDPYALMPEFSADQIGNYKVTLTVFDGTATSGPDTVTISTANVPPVAHAGLNQSANISDIITLDGSASSDVDGDPLTYLWSLDAIPASSGAMLSDPTAIQPDFQVDLLGEYVVSLIVNDGSTDSAPDIVTITTGNTPPVADAGLDQSVAVTSLVQLDGTGSSDANSDPLTYLWSLPSIPAGSTTSIDNPALPSPSFTADIPGTYIGQLIVNDVTEDSEPDMVVFTTDNVRPVANAGLDQTGVFVGDTVLLDGGGSSDADGTLPGFSWALIKQPSGSTAALTGPVTATPSFVPDVPGMYIVQLIVDDTVLDSAPDTAVVTVDATVLPAPTLDVGVSPTTDNPYSITGTASPNASVDIYVQGVLQHQVTSDPTTGLFSLGVYLFDGVNDIYAIERVGVDVSPASNTLHVQYDTVVDKNNLPSTISVDTVWTTGGTPEPYFIPSSLIISSGAKLILQAGVSVVFESNVASLQVSGHLIINGNENNKVLFTESVQSPGQGWNGIHVKSGGQVTINHAIIQHADKYISTGANSGVYFSTGSSGSISNSLIQNCYRGIEAEGNTSPSIGPGNTVTQNSSGIYITDGSRGYQRGSPTPTIFANNILNNTSLNIYVNTDFINGGGAPIDARGNYWGSTNLSDITGEMLYIHQIDFSGYLDINGDVAPAGILLRGSISTDTTLLENTDYDVLGTLQIAPGATLTIPKGTTLRSASYSGLSVSGELITLGTETEPVIFTSGQTMPDKGSWGSITINNGGNVTIDHAVIEYGFTGLSFKQGSMGSVTNSIIRRNSNDGVQIDNVSPIITNNTITENGVNEGSGISLVTSNGHYSAPAPEIKNNKIFDNRIPVSTGDYVGGRNVVIDMRENYWGSDRVSDIYMSTCRGNSTDACVDYSDYLDVNGNIVVRNSLLGVLQQDVTLLPDTTYDVLTYVEVPEGFTLTIPAGTTLIFYGLHQSFTVYGNLVVNGTTTQPVVFTSGRDNPVEGARDLYGDWDGIDIYTNASLTMESAIIQYADRALSISGTNVSGSISNSVIEKAGIGVEFYSDASNVSIGHTLFRLNDTAIDVTGSSSPTIGPANTIKQNNYGIYLRQLSNFYPSAVVTGNYIFDNNVYNINVNEYIGGDSVIVDVRGNYWGTDDPVIISSKMRQGGSTYPTIDFSDFILTADVPPGTGSSPVAQELLSCPVVRITDDSNFLDLHPQDNIDWIGSNFTDVQEIEKAFNNARAIDHAVFQYLNMPTQEVWDAMSLQEKGLYLVNSERQARGIKPFEGVNQDVVNTAQNYVDYIRSNNQVFGHYNDGRTPLQRLDETPVIRDNRDVSTSPENGYEIHGAIPVPPDNESLVRAIYSWIYYDKFPALNGPSWGHRDSMLQTGLIENSGETYREGLIGFGISSGVYNPDSVTPADNGALVFINIFDPSDTWDHSSTLTVDTDSAQLCNDRLVISIDETSVPDINELKSLTITPTDIYLTPGATEQLRVIATFQDPILPRDITSAASFVADELSVINIDGGYLTALKTGDVHAVANVNDVTSNRVLIRVRDAADSSNLVGTYAENFIQHIPENASIQQYDPKVFSLFTGLVTNRTGSPLLDVIVSVLDYPEYGSVKTDGTGRFIMAASAGAKTLVYRKADYLTVHRSSIGSSNNWVEIEDVIMLQADSKETSINLALSEPQLHTSTVVTDAFGSRSTTLVFNGITSATVTSSDGSQRVLTDFSVRATEYELPKSMPAELPYTSAFTYCSELQVPGLRDDDEVTFDNPVVMYVDNFLGFNVGEIVPIGYYDRQLGDWQASENGIVVKLLDDSGDGNVDGIDFDGDDVADDLNQNGSTTDEAVGMENFTAGSTYWRGSFDHFTPWDFNWPYQPPLDATDRGEFDAETGSEDKKQNEKVCTASYVKPEVLAFHEDIPVTGTNLTLHYSSQRAKGYKHKFNIPVRGAEVPDSLLEIIVKLEIAGHVFEESYSSASFSLNPGLEAEFIWDGYDVAGNRVKGVATGLVSIGYRYSINYNSAGFVVLPIDQDLFRPAWAKVGNSITNIPGRGEFISWSTNSVSVQNTFDNQIADGWTLSNHHLLSSTGDIYKGDGEADKVEKLEIILRTGIKISSYNGDDGFYQKGGKDIDYAVNILGTLDDKVTGLEWEYTTEPEKFLTIQEADNYCAAAPFTDDKAGWRLPNKKEIVYTIDKSGANHDLIIYEINSISEIWSTSNNNPDDKLLPVVCVRGDSIETLYTSELKRNDVEEVVVDGQTGLMWQDNVSNASLKLNWIDSIDHCENLNHAGYIDWRLPNINELAYSLPNSVFVNQTTYPANETWGPTAPNRKPYWSSSPYAGFTNYSWAMESAGHSSPAFNHSDLYYVRCVRDNIEAVRSPYVFDEYGKHIKTLDLNSGKTLTTFEYDDNNRLVSIIDRFGDTVTINRDGLSGKALSIRSEDGYVTQLTIATNGPLEDQNNHLTQVDFADGSNYKFGYYNNTALMNSETDPNNNVFYHDFDPVDGRVKQTSDPEGGIWNFTSTRQGNKSALYGYTTAEINSYQTLRTILDNGDTNKVTTLFDGTQLTDLTQADDLKQTLQSCSVTTVIDKVIDSKTKEEIPGTITISQPGGLTNITQFTKTYAEDGADVTEQTLTINHNGKTSSVVTDTTTGSTTVASAENRVTSLNYDPDTLLLSSKETAGLFSTTYTYDTRGRQKTVTTGARTTTFTYNPVSKGDVTFITADDGKITEFEYDALGRVKTIIYPDTHRTENIYDYNGNVTTRVIPTPANHDFTFNSIDKVKTETVPKDGVITEVTQYDYDKDRNLLQITLPSMNVISNSYTGGVLDFTSTPEGLIDYSYTCNSKVESITEGTETVTYGYDGSLLEDITYAGALNEIISQSYNIDFNINTLTYAGQTTVLGYDNDGLLAGANGYTISRNTQNGLPEILANGTLLQNRIFNGYGEAEAVTTKVNTQDTYDYTLSYNDLGKITSKTETLDDGTLNTYVYAYDDRRRLNTVTKNGILVEDYDYDANGNRILQTNTARGINAQSASYNLGDQLQTVGTTTYDYDADGYLKEKVTAGGATTYQYSSQGRLIRVQTPGKLIEYKHNAIGNRVEKKVDGVVIEKYLWLDKTTLLATYDATDTLLQRYHYTDGNTPDSFTQSGLTYYIVTDHLGSPRVITDAAGVIVKKLDYDSFGNVTSDSNPGFTFPFGFAGGLWDKDTGLIRFGFRDYDPDTGRWTARDPIGFSGGDTNLYGYVFSDPINFIDQSGLISLLLGGSAESTPGMGGATTGGFFVSDFNSVQNVDAGVFNSNGSTTGFNAGIGITLEVLKGGRENIDGKSTTLSVCFGPICGRVHKNSKGETIGGGILIGAGLPGGFSSSENQTTSGSVMDFFCSVNPGSIACREKPKPCE